MGIAKPKRLLHNGVARVKPTCHTIRRPKDMPKADWEEVLASMGPTMTVVPRLLVYVKTDNRDAKRRVGNMLHNTGCKVQEQHPFEGGYSEAMVITGSVDQLKLAIAHSCVIRWELCMNARVGYLAQGGGPEKICSSSKEPRKSTWHGRPEEEQASHELARQAAANTKRVMGS